VADGKPVRLTAEAAQCPLTAGSSIEFFRNGKSIGVGKLDAGCTKTLRVRPRRNSQYSAEVHESANHLAATSNKVTVRLKRR
jgi:hypothetical protein